MNCTPLLVTILVLGSLSTGCASRTKKPVYTTGQTGTVIRQEGGEIVAVNDVIIKPDDRRTIYGGPGRRIGTSIGTAVGRGSIRSVAGAIGGIIGGGIGGQTDERPGEEIHIRMDRTDEVIIIVQERGETLLAPGDRVSVQVASAGHPRAGGSVSGIVALGGSARVVLEPKFNPDQLVALGDAIPARSRSSRLLER